LQVATGHAGVADTHKSFKNGLPYVLIMQDVFETVKAANGGEGGGGFHKRPFAQEALRQGQSLGRFSSAVSSGKYLSKTLCCAPTVSGVSFLSTASCGP
jgi:hypothetical protein